MTITRIGSDEQRAELISAMKRVGDVVVHEPESTIVLSNGEKSNYYLWVKKALARSDVREKIADIITDVIDDGATFVAAAGYGGVPIACAVSDMYGDIDVTMVRDAPKGHGMGGELDGHIPKEGEVGVVVDDVLNSGGSLRRIDAAIEKTKAEITQHFVVGDRSTSEMPYEVYYILRVDDLEPGKK